MTDRLRHSGLPCPVCPGIRLSNFRVDGATGLELDHCPRCGGVWFDRAEVAALRSCKPAALAKVVHLSSAAYQTKCRGCPASYRRDLLQCPACRRKNILQCPRCNASMEVFDRRGVRLDACRKCEGVWFDNVELGAIWNTEVENRAVAGHSSPHYVDHFILPDVLWIPTDFSGLPNVSVDPGAIVEGVGHAASGAIEATGELAGGVFEAVAEIVGGLFDGI